MLAHVANSYIGPVFWTLHSPGCGVCCFSVVSTLMLNL